MSKIKERMLFYFLNLKYPFYFAMMRKQPKQSLNNFYFLRRKRKTENMKHSFSNLYLIVLFEILFNACAFGQCITGDCENGNGTYIFPDKSKAEGSWRNGKLNGKCKIFYIPYVNRNSI
jgi:hypothetical protein